MRTPLRWINLLALLLLATAACAAPASGPAARDRSLIVESELSGLPGGMNAFEAVQRLRPFWLNVRANRSFNGAQAEVLVYQGEMRLGDVESLKNIRASEVLRFEYLDPSQAVAKLTGIGNSRPAGVIVVHMRVG
ncbi:MAG TPA: hypothetical protein VEQ60_28650 [Longimicrobium sp.]|nr:hypothetical protein [Longimicrobium sp.]